MLKALVTLGGTPLVTHAVRRLVAAGGVSHVVVTVPATHEAEFAEALVEFAGPGDSEGVGHSEGADGPERDRGAGEAASPVRVQTVVGGTERSDSVRCGLRALDRACDVVLVHDAARALAPVTLIERVIAGVDAGADAVIPGIAVADTIKVVSASSAPSEEAAAGRDGEADPALEAFGPGAAWVVTTPSRADLRAVQTPQGFRRSCLVAAHESGLDATDDAALVERSGGRVVVIDGDVLALKVTTPLDIVVAEHLLADLSEAEPA